MLYAKKGNNITTTFLAFEKAAILIKFAG